MKGCGAKKFGMSLETQGIKLFWRDIPGFCRDIPEAPKKFEKIMFGFNSRPLCLNAPNNGGSFSTYTWSLTWAKSRESYCRIASESYGSDSNHKRSLAVRSPPKNTEFGPRRPCVRCAAIRIARLAFAGVVFVPRGPAEWPARVDRVR